VLWLTNGLRPALITGWQRTAGACTELRASGLQH
jgi:hypothetical protein